jgi:hypothetical protein
MTAAAPPPAAPPLETRSGALTFARFAAPPNALGYCGGSDSDALVGHLKVGLDGPELVALCRAFEGAWPYLELIAGSAGLSDPLDPRVVEAYWLGSGLLDAVPPQAFMSDLERRFRARTPAGEWPWLSSKPAEGARPHHSFHVLEVMPRIGMLRAGQVAAILPAMEQCLIRPAIVLATTSDAPAPGSDAITQPPAVAAAPIPDRRARDGQLTVAVRPLLIDDGKLALGPAVEQTVTGGADDVHPGDAIAVHWGWSCGRITPPQARRLARVTADAMRRANETI